MTTAEIVSNFFTEFKENFKPSKELLAMEMGYKNLSQLKGCALLFLVDKGTTSISSMEDDVDQIECVIYVQNVSSLDQQTELLNYKDELTDFFRTNHSLGGVNDITTSDWEFNISSDGINVGLLTYNLTLSVVR